MTHLPRPNRQNSGHAHCLFFEQSTKLIMAIKKKYLRTVRACKTLNRIKNEDIRQELKTESVQNNWTQTKWNKLSAKNDRWKLPKHFLQDVEAEENLGRSGMSMWSRTRFSSCAMKRRRRIESCLKDPQKYPYRTTFVWSVSYSDLK
jgi:hypothetical protein